MDLVKDLEKKWLKYFIFSRTRGLLSKEQVEEKILRLYHLSWLKKPSQIVWCKSPAEYMFYLIGSVEIFLRDIRKVEYVDCIDSIDHYSFWTELKKSLLSKIEDNFINHHCFELFRQRIDDRNKLLYFIKRGESVKCRILPLLDESNFSFVVNEFDIDFMDFHNVIGEWGWLLAILGEINRIFEFSNECSDSYFYEEYKCFHKMLNVTFWVYPRSYWDYRSNFLSVGFLPNKKLLILLETVLAEKKLKKAELEKIQHLIDLFKNGIWIIPYENVCWIIEGPHKIKLTKLGSGYLIPPNSLDWFFGNLLNCHLYGFSNGLIELPHSDRGPAIKFKDGFSIWAIDGVIIPPRSERVFRGYWKHRINYSNHNFKNTHKIERFYTKELMEALWTYGRFTPYRELWTVFTNFYIEYAPSEVFSVDMIFEEENAHLRRVLLNKIGLQRVINELKVTTIDRWNDYELIKVRYEKGSTRWEGVFLKMRNPSTGEYHIEGVSPYVRTCKEALSWRIEGLEWNPVEIT